jgi:hypothetical protein
MRRTLVVFLLLGACSSGSSPALPDASLDTAPEACAGDACTDALPAAGGEPLWARSAGDGASQFGYAVALDSAKNVFVGGEFAGVVDFGGGPMSLTGTSLTNGFVAKLDANGRHLWSKRLGGSKGGDQTVHVVAVDPSGNVFVGGFFSEEIDCGGGPLVSAGSTDAYVAKFDSLGNHLWSARFGDVEPQSVSAIAFAPDGGFVVGGDFGGTIDLGGGPLTSAGNEDVYVARFDASGKHVWSRRFGADDNERTPRVAVDSKGAVIVSATYRNQPDLGGGPLPDRYDGAFLLKLSADGAFVFGKGFDATKYQFPAAVAIDAGDGIVLAGRFTAEVDFGAGKLTSESGEDGFVASFDPNGKARWSQRFGGFGQDGVNGLAIDAKGNLLLTGEFTTAFEGLTSAGAGDLFVAKLASSGATLWARRYGDAQEQQGMRIAVASDGTSAVVGSFFGALAFTPTLRLSSNGGFNLSGGDAFVVVVGP